MDRANNCVELICDGEANSSHLAFVLGHELVHVEQENSLKSYPSDLSPVDYLVRTRLIEADAFAMQMRIGYEMKENGVDLPSWSSHPNSIPATFEEFLDLYCPDAIKTCDAKKYATFVIFFALAKPGVLDPYERTILLHDTKLYERSDLPDLIAQSPFFQAKFIHALTTHHEETYSLPDCIPGVQKNLLKIGKSDYARSKLKQAYTLAA